MKLPLCYMILLFAAHTDSIAGILRGLKDVSKTDYILVPNDKE
jgi:hypothetical protein